MNARGAPRRRSRVWFHVVLAAGLVAAACSDDNDDSSAIATVRGHEIFESDVEALASDAGFLSFIRAPQPDEGADLSQTEAGRRTLTWLIDRSLVDAELAAQNLSVDEETVDDARTDLLAGETPDELDVGAIVDGGEAMGDDALAEAADGLAAYMTLDEWLRTIDPTDLDLHERLVTEHPEVRDRVCGSAVAVDEADAGAVRDVLNGGGTLAQVADDLTLARTPPEGACLTRGSYPRQLVDVLYGTPIGSVGEKRVISRSTGQPVVFFVVPASRDLVPPDEIDDAITTTLQRLHDQGGAAFAELGFSTVDPDLDFDWGTWDPTVGVVAPDAAPLFTSFDLPEPTTTTPPTTAAPTTTAPPPPPAPATEFVEASEPILAGNGPGDPGTGDLLARSEAALDATIPTPWRQAVVVQLSIISGPTSWSWPDGRIEVGSVHASGNWSKLEAVMDHEFGHQIAFRYGSQAENGAAPAGWPVSGSIPVETWADCVSETYTGYGLATGGGPCAGESLAWTVDWLAAGPAAHPRTG